MDIHVCAYPTTHRSTLTSKHANTHGDNELKSEIEVESIESTGLFHSDEGLVTAAGITRETNDSDYNNQESKDFKA